MKIRTGFVTNSSSTSYYLLIRDGVNLGSVSGEEAISIVSNYNQVRTELGLAVSAAFKTLSAIYYNIECKAVGKDEIYKYLVEDLAAYNKEINNIDEWLTHYDPDDWDKKRDKLFKEDIDSYSLYELKEDEYETLMYSFLEFMYDLDDINGDVILIYDTR